MKSFNSQPLISAIIIFWNHEPFIPEAIASIFDQTYEHWELLLVDDGSTDGSSAIAQQYARKYPEKVRYLEHPEHQNRGVSASRNLGIAHAKGDYIGFLDAKDLWLPQKLEQQIAILSTYPEVAMVYGRTQIWYSWTENQAEHQLDYFCELGVQPNLLVEPPNLLLLLCQNQYQTATSSDALIPRKIFEEIGQFEEAFPEPYEDQGFFAKVYLNAPVFVSEQFWTKSRQYRNKDGSVTENIQDPSTRLKFLTWLENYLSQQGCQNRKVWQTIQAERENYSIEKVTEKISLNYPNFKIGEILFLGEGINNRAYRINNEYIFRFPKTLPSEKALKSEILLLDYLKNKINLSVPDICFIGNKYKIKIGVFWKIEQWIVDLEKIMERIRYRFNLDINFITKFYDKNFPNAQRLFVGYKEIKGSFLYPEFVRQSSYETQQKIAKALGEFLSVLHSLPLSIVSQFGIPEKKLRKKYYLYHEQILVKEILPQLNLEEQEIISQFFGDAIKDINFDDNSSILHGDLNWDHLIFDETQNHLVGIIDFGGVFLGDPTRDFTTILVQFGEDFLQLILQFYQNKNQSNYSSSNFLNRIKLRHCCDCISLIHQGIEQQNSQRIKQGVEQLKKTIVNLKD